MIKFCSKEEVYNYKYFAIFHDIEISNSITIKQGTIIDDKIIDMIDTFLPANKLLIVVDDNVSKRDIKEFIVEKFKIVYLTEFEYLNKRYNSVFNDTFQETMIEFFNISIMSLDVKYLIMLLTNPIVLRKSIDLSIMSFYFSIKTRLTPREIDDVFYSSILCNLNICKCLGMDMEDSCFLVDFKKGQGKSYDMIKDDKQLSNNVKRILLYFNDHTYSQALYVNSEVILKDPTLEILQLSNDLLTYNFEDGTISLYSKKYTLIQPIINDFFKNMKNMKHKIKLQRLRKKLRLW